MVKKSYQRRAGMILIYDNDIFFQVKFRYNSHTLFWLLFRSRILMLGVRLFFSTKRHQTYSLTSD